MNSDIQESSIDYHDNSLMSSTANMFNDISDSAPRDGLKPKKKAKRNQVKQMDPKAFDWFWFVNLFIIIQIFTYRSFDYFFKREI